MREKGQKKRAVRKRGDAPGCTTPSPPARSPPVLPAPAATRWRSVVNALEQPLRHEVAVLEQPLRHKAEHEAVQRVLVVPCGVVVPQAYAAS